MILRRELDSLLKITLYYQQLAGVEIVSEEDMNSIKKRWYEEFGWVENEDDLRPELLDYVGALVLDEHYNVNWKESSIPNMVLSWKEDGLEETEQARDIQPRSE
ncbi:hypothetical protein [Brevibacillus sp. NRS-1366]|uniref:hypothetical protein n=1 Tax=Brevibacillus sp. NRS-1366 TaxID=3233899 RepID=UPI003D25015A